MLKRTLPGLSEEETKEYRHLDYLEGAWCPTEGFTSEDRARLGYLRSQIVWARVGNE